MKRLAMAAALCVVITACKKTEDKTVQAETTVVTPETTGATTQTTVTTATLDDEDAEFYQKASEGALFEVQLGKLAMQKATNPKVKELASQIVTDHTKGKNELDAYGKSKNLANVMKLGAEKQAKYDKFAAMTGADFDKAYADFMVEDHKEDIEKFEEQAKEGKDAELKALAEKTLPTLKHHLMMAEEAKNATK